MLRLPTTLALAPWLGFLLLSAALSAAGSVDQALQGTPTPLFRIDPSVLMHQAGLAPILLLVAAGLIAGALFFLHEPRIDRRALGEGLGYGGLGLVALVASGSGAGVFSIDVSGGAFWALLGAAAAAIAFDHLVADEAPDDEEEFRAGIEAIAQAMARQTYLHTEPHGPDREVPRR